MLRSRRWYPTHRSGNRAAPWATTLAAMMLLVACSKEATAPSDDSAPVIRLVTPAGWSVLSGVARIDVVAEGARSLLLEIDDQSVDTGTPPNLAWDTSRHANGAHRARLIASNAAGSVDTTLILVSDNPGMGVAVLLTPREIVVEPAGELQFSTRVLGTTDQRTSWRLLPPVVGSTAWGTLSNEGRYIAPNGLPNPPRVTILVASVADPSRVAAASVRIEGLFVEMSSPVTSILLGQAVQLRAGVHGVENSPLLWRVIDSPVHGTISEMGLYQAPDILPDPPEAIVEAESVEHPGKLARLTLLLRAPVVPPPPPPPPVPVVVTVAPTSVDVLLASSFHFEAQVTGTEDPRVVWTIDAGAAFGTIDAAGIYHAPNTLPDPPMATVRATSVVDTTSSATALVQLQNLVMISVSPSAATIQAGDSLQFTATVLNTADTRVTWELSNNLEHGTISSSGLYTAPPAAPFNPVVLVIARSLADPSRLATASVTIRSAPPVPPQDESWLRLLGDSGYTAAQACDQAVEIALQALRLAAEKNGGQVTTTGWLRRVGNDLVYEPDSTMSTLRIDGITDAELTVNEFDLVSWGNYQNGQLSLHTFLGSLSCRLTTSGGLDLRITRSSHLSEQGYVYDQFIRGSIPDGPLSTIGVHHFGTHPGVSFHFGNVDHHVTGEVTTRDGYVLTLNESLQLGFSEYCYAAPRSTHDSWSQSFTNTLQSGPFLFSLTGLIGGVVEGNCGYTTYAVRLDRWVALGGLLRNGVGYGGLDYTDSLEEGRTPPGVRLWLNSGVSFGFREPGLSRASQVVTQPAW